MTDLIDAPAPTPTAIHEEFESGRPAAVASSPSRWRVLLRPARYYLCSRLMLFAVVLFAGATSTKVGPLRKLATSWDGHWYLLIAQHGYPQRIFQEGEGSRWAFFPAFPAAVRGVAEVTRLSLPDAGVVAAFVFGLTATVAVWLAVREVFGTRLADRTTLLFVFSPLACILSFAYTEGLFLTAAAGALYALQRRWWFVAAAFACLAGLTRNTGVVVVLCVVVVALGAAWREKRWRPALAAAVAPLGLASFMAYGWAEVGTPFAFLRAAHFWKNQHFVWFTTPFRAMFSLLTLHVNGNDLALYAYCTAALLFAYFGVLCLVLLARERRLPTAWKIYVAGTILVAFSSYYTGGIPRYTMVAFPLIVGIVWKLRSSSRVTLIAVCAVLQCVVAIFFLTGAAFVP